MHQRNLVFALALNVVELYDAAAFIQDVPWIACLKQKVLLEFTLKKLVGSKANLL